MDLRIKKGSHYFSVFAFTAKGAQFRREFCDRFIEMSLVKKRGRFSKQPKRVFARRDLNKGEISFHISSLDAFKKEAENFNWSGCKIEIEEVPVNQGDSVVFNTEINLWEEQKPIVDFCLNDMAINVITAQPGAGKTIMSLAAASKIGKRFAVITLGGYEDRWIPELYSKMGLKPEEVRSCCGCMKLYRLLREIKNNGIGKIKAIFISTATLREFIKNWNNGKVVGSGCEDIDPSTLWQFLGVGLLICDEAHKEVHCHAMISLITNTKKIIYLTATLLPSTDFLKFVYDTFFPKSCRKDTGKINKYVDVVKVVYNLKDWRKAKFIGGQGSYSHTTYEQWIMADKDRKRNYTEAIYEYADNVWYKGRKSEHKLLVFASTIDLCQHFSQTFSKKWPELKVNSFTSGDDYQTLLDSHVIFSTLGKSGTAVDIPDLTQAILTVAVDSPNANIQALGRLRELKGEKAFKQTYHCFVCNNIDKHIDYWKGKERLFSGRITGTSTAHLDRVI